MFVRGAVGLASLESYSGDPDAYRAIASCLSSTGVYGLVGADDQPHATAFRPPLYPFVLSWITTDQGLSNRAVAVFHFLMGVATVALTFVACRRLLGERSPIWISSLAAILVAIDPILVQQSRFVMTETLATMLVVATIVIWCGRSKIQHDSIGSGLACGVLLSLAFLCRPTFLVWAALLSLGWLLIGVLRSRKRTMIAGCVMGATVLVTVGLWTVRNQRAVGHPVWATTHGGYTLLLGNNPLFYDYLREGNFGRAWDAEPFLLAYTHRYDGDPNDEAFWHQDWQRQGTITRQVTEHEDDRVAYNAARSTIDREPAMFIKASIVRVGRLWTPLPHTTAERRAAGVWIVGTYYAVFYAAMFVGLWRQRRKVLGSDWWAVWALALTLSCVHAVYWSNLRMRAPIIPLMAIAAAAALVRPCELPSRGPEKNESSTD